MLVGVQIASHLYVIFVPVDAVHATVRVPAQRLVQVLGRIGRFEKVIIVVISASMHFDLFSVDYSIAPGIDASEKLHKSCVDQVFLFLVIAALKGHCEAEIDVDGPHLVTVRVVLALLDNETGWVVRAERVQDLGEHVPEDEGEHDK